MADRLYAVPMNQYFHFSDRQLKFVALLSAGVLIMGGYLFLRSYAYPSRDVPTLGVFLTETEPTFTGVFVLDPNTAPADSLELIGGIGPVLADNIVEYRRQHRIDTVTDIMNVPGIGPKTYEKIRPYLRINCK
ncbi:MAG: helix-hairpin-helix domain-containing protein [candidate division Zixibacteria bacterium]|nr:helix-hairpin-helix domain-containing protein [candidate division Zixibacteria bacterium]